MAIMTMMMIKLLCVGENGRGSHEKQFQYDELLIGKWQSGRRWARTTILLGKGIPTILYERYA